MNTFLNTFAGRLEITPQEIIDLLKPLNRAWSNRNGDYDDVIISEIKEIIDGTTVAGQAAIEVSFFVLNVLDNELYTLKMEDADTFDIQLGIIDTALPDFSYHEGWGGAEADSVRELFKEVIMFHHREVGTDYEEFYPAYIAANVFTQDDVDWHTV